MRCSICNGFMRCKIFNLFAMFYCRNDRTSIIVYSFDDEKNQTVIKRETLQWPIATRLLDKHTCR